MTPIPSLLISRRDHLRHKCACLAGVAFCAGFAAGILFSLQRPPAPSESKRAKAPAAVILTLQHLCEDFGGLQAFRQTSRLRFAADCRELASFPRVDFTELTVKEQP